VSVRVKKLRTIVTVDQLTRLLLLRPLGVPQFYIARSRADLVARFLRGVPRAAPAGRGTLQRLHLRRTSYVLKGGDQLIVGVYFQPELSLPCLYPLVALNVPGAIPILSF
jgi:hypothetical protein